MKFLGLRIFIAILELIAFVLIVPCLIVIGWAFFSAEHPLSGRSLAQAAIVIGVVGGALLMGIVVAAIASLLNLLLAIERNTANAAENTTMVEETLTATGGRSALHRFLGNRVWVSGASALVGLVVGVVLLVHFVAAPPLQRGRAGELAGDLTGNKPVTVDGPDDLYSLERVAEYCETHPTGFYGAVGNPSGVSCPDWARRNRGTMSARPEVRTAERRLFGK